MDQSSVQQNPRAGDVTLDTESQEALSDLCDCGYGTLVRLRLKDEFAVDEILAYFKTTFLYPSIPITFVNRDLLSRISKRGYAKLS